MFPQKYQSFDKKSIFLRKKPFKCTLNAQTHAQTIYVLIGGLVSQ